MESERKIKKKREKRSLALALMPRRLTFLAKALKEMLTSMLCETCVTDTMNYYYHSDMSLATTHIVFVRFYFCIVCPLLLQNRRD